MSVRVLTRSRAQRDVAEISEWYDSQRPGLGDDFLAEMLVAIKRIGQNPYAFQCTRKKPEIRRALTRRFPYRVKF